MSRVSLWDDEEPEQFRPRPRARVIEEEPEVPADSSSLAGLLPQMTTLLNIKTRQGGPWHARALGANGYGSGPTPEAAMRAALDARAKEKTK